jgi:hypothetical protein
MPFRTGWTITHSEGQAESKVDPLRQWGRTWSEESTSPRWFQTNAFRVEVPPGSSVEWPSYPFNPYAIDGAAPPAEAAARVSTPLLPGSGEKRFVIRIR